MPISLRQLGAQMRQNQDKRYPSYVKPEPLSGIMGRYPGDQSPAVADRAGWVWVRVFQLGNQPMRAYSPDIQAWPDLPVLVADERSSGGDMVVLGVNWRAFGGAGQWGGNGGGGGITPSPSRTNVYKRNIVDFHGHTDGGGANFIVEVYEDWFPVRGGTRFYAGGTVNLASMVPSSGSRFAHVYLQFVWNNATQNYDEVLAASQGDIVGAGVGPGGYPTTPDASEIYIPDVPAGAFPCLAVLLKAGATGITEADVYDTRSIWNPAGYGETATRVGQVMFSRDGAQFTAELPVTDVGGWLVDEKTGILLVHDIL